MRGVVGVCGWLIGGRWKVDGVACWGVGWRMEDGGDFGVGWEGNVGRVLMGVFLVVCAWMTGQGRALEWEKGKGGGLWLWRRIPVENGNSALVEPGAGDGHTFLTSLWLYGMILGSD